MYITIEKPKDMPNIIGYRLPDWYEQERFEKTLELVKEYKRPFDPTTNKNKILDIGCGLGVLSCEIANQYKTNYLVIAIENDKKLIPEIYRYMEKFNEEKGILSSFMIEECNGEDLPFETEFFDIILIEEVLEHTTDPKKMIKESIRVLKKGGMLIISVPNEDALPDPGHKNIFTKNYFDFLEYKTWVAVPDIWLMFTWIKK